MTHRGFLLALATLVLAAPANAFAEPRKLSLMDFETEAEAQQNTMAPYKTISADWASSGKKSLKFTTAHNWLNLEISDPETLKKLADYRTLTIDTYNPTPFPILFNWSVEDATSATDSRFNQGYCFIPAGKGSIHLALQAMPRQWPSENKVTLNPAALKRILFFMGRDTGEWNPPLTFHLDNIRAEHSGVELPAVEGLKAFTFARSRESQSVLGFTPVTEKTPANNPGFAFTTPPSRYFSGLFNPDYLGNSVTGGTFVVSDLKPGEYVVQVCMDTIGQWGWSAQFNNRSLKLNDKEVFAEKMDGAAFLKNRWCAFQDDEDTPATAIWNDRIQKLCPVRKFTATVAADGKLSVQYACDGTAGMSFLVLYPKAQEKQGGAYMDALNAIRKENFDARINLGYPVEEPSVQPDAKESARGFIAFPRIPSKKLTYRSTPAADERNAPINITATMGERTSIQLGLLPLRESGGITVSVSDLKGPANIPASAISVKKVRHFYKRFGNGYHMELMPLVLQDFSVLDKLPPGFTRPLWISIKVPDNAQPGDYSGTLTINAKDPLAIPFKVTVAPIRLLPIENVAISGMSGGAGFWREPYPESLNTWWAMQEKMAAMQADYGFNALTGGPGMTLKSIKDGKAEIDFAEADRWMDIAKKYNLTKLGDSYQGFSVVNLPRDQSAAGPEANEQAAKSTFGVSFPELIKITYAAVEAHAKEKNWPPRAYYLLDEPSGAAVEPARKFVAAYAENAPGTRFSGYYAPPDKSSPRDVFYPLLKLSVLSSFDQKTIDTIHGHKNQVWIYSNPAYTNRHNFRYLYGQWLAHAAKRGLDGITGGFYYVSNVPYYDMSDVEGSWGLAYPTPDGISPTVWLEEVSLGINDYRYIQALQRRLFIAQKANRNHPAVAEAEALLADLDKTPSLENDPWCSAKAIVPPEHFASFREKCIRLCNELPLPIPQ